MSDKPFEIETLEEALRQTIYDHLGVPATVDSTIELREVEAREICFKTYALDESRKLNISIDADISNVILTIGER